MSAEVISPEPVTLTVKLAQSAPTDINSVNPAEDFTVRYPPFPTAPVGVHITAFKDFNEIGIRVEPGPDDTEVDALGLATIPMLSKHATDVCKTNTKRKRQAEEKKRKGALPASSREWWDVWEDTEQIRRSTGFDPHSSRFERTQAATVDFTKDHTWPAANKKETGPKFIWEKFLLFIGVPEGYTPLAAQTQSKKAKREAKEDNEENEMSDDDDDMGDGTGVLLSKDAPGIAQALKAASSNEEKLQSFLDDPNKSIRIFMSSYAWAKGYIWSEENLRVIPRIIKYFIEYVIRSKVLPESERQLRRALDAVETALIELPFTDAAMKKLPESVGAGCTECWGKKVERYQMVMTNLPAPPEPEPVEEPETKKQKIDDEAAPSSSAGWGSTEGGWGSGEPGWGASAAEIAATNGWATTTISDEVWALDPVGQPFIRILGPTAFPLTHTPAVVERSMRRIKSILPPFANPPNSLPTEGPDATAVEIDLDRTFSKIVLAPMIDWDGGQAPVYTRPTILESSRGPVVEEGVAPAALAEGNPKPHDPLNDDITVLVEKAIAEVLREGMGVGGTWVQVVRQVAPVKKKKGKSKKPPVYWYLEEAAFVVPSYWTVNA